jgi:hypothetical protein
MQYYTFQLHLLLIHMRNLIVFRTMNTISEVHRYYMQ